MKSSPAQKPLDAARHLLTPAGGLSYHFRAAWFGTKQWGTTRRNVETWLQQWVPIEQHLLLIGPSAGYTLPFPWLGRFEKVTVFEPDPVARWLFRRRWRATLGARAAVKLEFVHEDYLTHQPERFVAQVDVRAPAAILYCNLVGQLSHLLATPEKEPLLCRAKGAVTETLRGRSWASYHDRVSSSRAPKIAALGQTQSGRLSDDELAQFYDGYGEGTILLDHDTEDVFPAHLPHYYFGWELIPGYFHLLEAVSHRE